MDNLKGMAWMTLAMFAFAITDMLIIFLARDLAVAQILLLSGIGGAILFAIWARVQGHRFFSPVLLQRSVMLRNLAEALATVSFITALSLIPLSQLSAVIQANPLLVTLGAALFLGEQVGWRRWLAIAIGLVGVMIIIRPGAEAFDPNIVWAVAAAIGLSLRDLATRPVPKTVSTTLLASYSFAAVALAGAAMMPFSSGAFVPTPAVWAILGAALLTSMLAVFAITAAMRVGDIAVVTPLRYSRLAFALIIALLVFDETLKVWTVIGVTIVIATGLYTFWREAQSARAARATPR